MKVRGGGGHLILLTAAALACGALLAPSGASAATVVNGDFESGTLQGWHVHRVTESGNWFAYKGDGEPIANKRLGEPIQAPPQGTYAAIADEINPDTLILYQDIALEPGSSHRLSLLTYYSSYEPIAVPTPDTLSVNEEVLGSQANQQYRIDLMRPEAPLESIDPADVLRTLFRTKPGDPEEQGPIKLTADLSPFAGQTVRLRIAVVAHEEVLAAGVDAVSISSTPPGQSPAPGSKSPGSKSPGSTSFRFGKARANRSNGTATLPVRVPGPGLLTAKSRKLIKPATVKAAGAGTVRIHLKPTPSALRTLRHKHKLRVELAVTYAPAAGSPETTTLPVVLELKARPRHRR